MLLNFVFIEVIASPPGMLRARMAILEKCWFGAHTPGKAEGFAITLSISNLTRSGSAVLSGIGVSVSF